jgi:hypothetical protein
MKYALIQNNQVQDIFIEPEGFTIEECLHEDIRALYIYCPDNITVDDFYNSETKEFSTNPDKKLPDYTTWIEALQNKTEELNTYSSSLNPTINNLSMFIGRLNEYKTSLGFVLTGVDENVEIDEQQFSADDFKLMVAALKKFEEDKSTTQSTHSSSINALNNATDIAAYDFTTAWPDINITV